MIRRGTQRPQFKGSPPSPVASFSPASIAGLELWLDASDASTITLDGSDKVEEWRDKSGNANHAAQASVTLRPGITTVNGLGAVVFDGVDDQMSGTELLTGDSDFTLFAVVRKDSTPTGGVAYFIIGNDENYGLCASGDTVYDRPSVLNGRVAFLSESSGTVANGSVFRQTLRRDEAPSALYYTRGTSVSLNWTNDPSPPPFGNYLLGRQSSTAQGVAICEIVLYTSNLSTPDQARVNDYLNARWGTT